MQTLRSTDPAFATALEQLLTRNEERVEGIAETVRSIIAEVRGRGDAAVLELTNRFDTRTLKNAAGFHVTAEQMKQAYDTLDDALCDALEIAAARIRAFYFEQVPTDTRYTDSTGITLGTRWTPVDAAGIYTPGGRAAYPSSVLMNAIPAKAAGVRRIVMAVPAPQGELNPAVLAAAHIAGVDEVYSIGGAQAVAALAYGTETIQPVDVIAGPGNTYVAEAKRQVFGQVGIDMIAGPSEILVVTDNQNNPAWIAADLLSQAEHDPTAQSILITDDAAYADTVAKTVEATLQTLPREAIARTSWDDFGAVIVVPSLDDAPALINHIAPEHLELAIEDPETLLPKIRHAGAIFLGRYTPEAIGDYVAGPSHVLPTSRTARFSSGLSVTHFMKRSSIIGCSPEGFAALAPSGIALAEAEGLQAHAMSMSVRVGDKG